MIHFFLRQYVKIVINLIYLGDELNWNFIKEMKRKFLMKIDLRKLI